MGFFRTSDIEAEEIRGGIGNDKLTLLKNDQLIMVAIARTMEGLGVDDQPLIDELYKRANS